MQRPLLISHCFASKTSQRGEGRKGRNVVPSIPHMCRAWQQNLWMWCSEPHRGFAEERGADNRYCESYTIFLLWIISWKLLFLHILLLQKQISWNPTETRADTWIDERGNACSFFSHARFLQNLSYLAANRQSFSNLQSVLFGQGTGVKRPAVNRDPLEYL